MATQRHVMEDAQILTLSSPPYAIVAVNQACVDLCGYTSAEAIGRTCRFLQGPATSRAVLSDLHTAIARKRRITVQLVNYTKSGNSFVIELTIEPLFDSQGTVTHFRGTLRLVGTPYEFSSSSPGTASLRAASTNSALSLSMTFSEPTNAQCSHGAYSAYVGQPSVSHIGGTCGHLWHEEGVEGSLKHGTPAVMTNAIDQPASGTGTGDTTAMGGTGSLANSGSSQLTVNTSQAAYQRPPPAPDASRLEPTIRPTQLDWTHRPPNVAGALPANSAPSPRAAAGGGSDSDNSTLPTKSASLASNDSSSDARMGGSGEIGEKLLSRDAFPLHTLNNHPIAPVLLRMLQLNSCTSRASSSTTATDTGGAPARAFTSPDMAAMAKKLAGGVSSGGVVGPQSTPTSSYMAIANNGTGSGAGVDVLAALGGQIGVGSSVHPHAYPYHGMMVPQSAHPSGVRGYAQLGMMPAPNAIGPSQQSSFGHNAHPTRPVLSAAAAGGESCGFVGGRNLFHAVQGAASNLTGNAVGSGPIRGASSGTSCSTCARTHSTSNAGLGTGTLTGSDAGAGMTSAAYVHQHVPMLGSMSKQIAASLSVPLPAPTPPPLPGPVVAPFCDGQRLPQSEHGHESIPSALTRPMRHFGSASAPGQSLTVATETPGSFVSPAAATAVDGDSDGVAACFASQHDVPKRSGNEFLAAVAGQGVITSCANPTGYWQGQRPGSTESSARSGTPNPSASEVGGSSGGGCMLGGPIEDRSTRKRPCDCEDHVHACSSTHAEQQPLEQQQAEPSEPRAFADAAMVLSNPQGACLWRLPTSMQYSARVDRMQPHAQRQSTASTGDLGFENSVAAIDRAHDTQRGVANFDPSDDPMQLEQKGYTRSEHGVEELPLGHVRSASDMADVARSEGSAQDLQQLAAAFARSASQQQSIDALNQRGRGSAASNDGSRLWPPAPVWARAFSTFGGLPSSSSAKPPSRSTNFGAGADELGEMQLDGILDMLDNWDQFERPHDPREVAPCNQRNSYGSR